MLSEPCKLNSTKYIGKNRVIEWRWVKCREVTAEGMAGYYF